MEPSLSVPLSFNKKNFALISPNFPNYFDPKKPKFDIPNLALLNLNTQPSPNKTSHLDLISNTSGTMAHNILLSRLIISYPTMKYLNSLWKLIRI